MIDSVTSHGDLSDDATALCLDWRGTHSTRRIAGTGADLAATWLDGRGSSKNAGHRTDYHLATFPGNACRLSPP